MGKLRIMLLLFVFCFIASACSSESTSNVDYTEIIDGEAKAADEQETVFEVELDHNIEIYNNSVLFSGSTNFLDGTILYYHIVNLDTETEIKGEIIVNDGAFAEEVDISELEPGNIEAILMFLPIGQEYEIEKVYGSKGENLSGSMIFVTDNDVHTVYVSETGRKLETFTLEGSGDTATETFPLFEGFVILDSSHEGNRNFTVRLVNIESGDEKLMANGIGNYTGKNIMWVDHDNEFFIEVKGDGNWRITVDQTLPDLEDANSTIKGTGDDVVFVRLNEGLMRFKLSHDGERNFTAWINDSVLIANAVGKYEGSTSEKIPNDSIYFINIKGDGNWTLDIEPY